MAARRRGEDIIDFSMVTRTVRLRRTSSKNYVRWPRPGHAWLLHFTRHSAATSRHSRWYQDRYDVEIDPESEAIVLLVRKRDWHIWCWRRWIMVTGAGAESKLPHSYLWRGDCRAQVRSVPLVEGVDFFNELERPFAKVIRNRRWWSSASRRIHRAMRGAGVLRKGCGAGETLHVLVVHDLAYADIVYDGWKARQSCRCRVHAMWRSSSLRCRKLQHGGLAYRLYGWQQNAGRALARIKSYHDYGTFTPLQVQRLRRWRAINSACATLLNSTTPPWCTGKRAAWSGLDGRNAKASMYVWAKIPEPYAAMGSWNLPRSCWTKRRSVSLRGLAWRLRRHACSLCTDWKPRPYCQAIRGIKAMFRADGLLPASANIFTKMRNKHRPQKCKQEPMAPVFHCTVCF